MCNFLCPVEKSTPIFIWFLNHIHIHFGVWLWKFARRELQTNVPLLIFLSYANNSPSKSDMSYEQMLDLL